MLCLETLFYVVSNEVGMLSADVVVLELMRNKQYGSFESLYK